MLPCDVIDGTDSQWLARKLYILARNADWFNQIFIQKDCFLFLQPLNGEQLNIAPEVSVTPPSPVRLTQDREAGKSSSSEKIAPITPKLKKRKHNNSPAMKSPVIKSLLLGMKKDKDKVSDSEAVGENNAKESSEMEEEGTVSECADDGGSQGIYAFFLQLFVFIHGRHEGVVFSCGTL